MPELMKGHEWSKRKQNMSYPCWCEIKHDEIRCHVKVDRDSVEFLSYAGKLLPNMEQFIPMWRQISAATGYIEFDTGFEANGSFAESMRWIKSTKGLPDNLLGVACKFFLFDLPDLAKTGSYPGAPFHKRMQQREQVVATALDMGYGEIVFASGGKWAADEAEVLRLFTDATECGYEGLMVKSLEHLYMKGKRTDGWLKLKPTETADGEIIELIRAVSLEGKPLDRIGSIRVRLEDGSEATPAGLAHDLGRQMWLNKHIDNGEKFIGQWIEFKYMERDRAGGYRHPTFIRFREEKK